MWITSLESHPGFGVKLRMQNGGGESSKKYFTFFSKNYCAGKWIRYFDFSVLYEMMKSGLKDEAAPGLEIWFVLR